MSSEFVRDIQYALQQIPKVRAKSWIGFGGQSLEPNLSRLEVILHDALREAGEGSGSPGVELNGLATWVADWIPDLDHPLLDAVYRVQQHALATPEEGEYSTA